MKEKEREREKKKSKNIDAKGSEKMMKEKKRTTVKIDTAFKTKTKKTEEAKASKRVAPDDILRKANKISRQSMEMLQHMQGDDDKTRLSRLINNIMSKLIEHGSEIVRFNDLIELERLEIENENNKLRELIASQDVEKANLEKTDSKLQEQINVYFEIINDLENASSNLQKLQTAIANVDTTLNLTQKLQSTLSFTA